MGINAPVSLPVQGRITCDFTIRLADDSFVAITDECDTHGGRSVTNAAEEVVAFLLPLYPGRRIIYRDTEGRWDELAHDGKKFTGFKPMPSCFRLEGTGELKMLPTAVRKRMLSRARAEFKLDQTGVHGPAHWQRVRDNGLRLAESTGADTTVIELFAFLHDCKRENDGTDPQHGARAAGFLWDIRHLFPAEFSIAQMAPLTHAIEFHSDGLTVIAGKLKHRVTVATCWDADRLDLGRVGIVPDPMMLCTDAARAPAILKWAYERSIK